MKSSTTSDGESVNSAASANGLFENLLNQKQHSLLHEKITIPNIMTAVRNFAPSGVNVKTDLQYFITKHFNIFLS